jgi:hypothetical protein
LQWNSGQLQSFHDGFMTKRRARILLIAARRTIQLIV